MINLEVCIDNIESLFTAQRAGADRIELCSALALGGLSPTTGLIAQALKHATVPVHVMIRPREGDFLYSSDEIEVMLSEIHAARALGVAGVVLGVLNQQAQIDSDLLHRLMRQAQGMSVTFHRAIDCCADAESALETLLDAQCPRVLTSGLSASAELGVARIKRMVTQSQGRLAVMAGAGINAANVAQIIHETGVQEVHLSGKVSRTTAMESVLNCGHLAEFRQINVTSYDNIHALKQVLTAL